MLISAFVLPAADQDKGCPALKWLLLWIVTVHAAETLQKSQAEHH